MYLGIDIGGTKTLVARFDASGKIKQRLKFPTPLVYADFLREIAGNVVNISAGIKGVCVAAPGRIDRTAGIGKSFGNLPWHNVPLKRDLEKLFNASVVVENDANLAGLAEAMLRKSYNCVLYVTISTGIGTGIITNQQIDPELADSEGGQIMLEHHNRITTWESFASGKAIVRRYGKRASEITDVATWKAISRDLAIGLYDLITFIQPDIVVLGGGVATYYQKFDTYLKAELHRYETPLVPIPPIVAAKQPEEAVVYGCYYLARQTYGNVR